MERLRIRDDMVVGLHVTINNTGLITFHISYEVGTDPVRRHHLLLGSLNKEREDCITIEKARDRAKIVKALAAEGLNVQDGLYKRLMREIDEKGTAWRPK